MNQFKILETVIDKFKENHITLALAESCTGGYISHMLTNISGASNVFERGIVCYSNKAKEELLNVESSSIIEHGAVSETVARQLAYNVRILSRTTIGIGITGIAGPTGGTPEKPVGLVFIGFSTDNNTIVEKHIFQSDRVGFKQLVLKRILDFLLDFKR